MKFALKIINKNYADFEKSRFFCFWFAFFYPTKRFFIKKELEKYLSVWQYFWHTTLKKPYFWAWFHSDNHKKILLFQAKLLLKKVEWLKRIRTRHPTERATSFIVNRDAARYSTDSTNRICSACRTKDFFDI